MHTCTHTKKKSRIDAEDCFSTNKVNMELLQVHEGNIFSLQVQDTVYSLVILLIVHTVFIPIFPQKTFPLTYLHNYPL